MNLSQSVTQNTYHDNEIDYCLGFLFSNDLDFVILLKKAKTLHVGLWNGLGGKVETYETRVQAMERECFEESGLRIDKYLWKWLGFLEIRNDKTFARVSIYAHSLSYEKLADIKPRLIAIQEEVNIENDTPYLVDLGILPQLDLAPHTGALIYSARETLKDPTSTRCIIFKEKNLLKIV